MTDISATIESIKAAYAISNTLADDLGVEILREKIIELQRLLLSAEESAAGVLLTLNALKEEAAKIRSWNHNKKSYSLKEISPGVFAYAVISKMPNDPNPYFCADCFHLGKMSILQFQFRTKSGFKHFNCHSCGATIETQGTSPQDNI